MAGRAGRRRRRCAARSCTCIRRITRTMQLLFQVAPCTLGSLVLSPLSGSTVPRHPPLPVIVCGLGQLHACGRRTSTALWCTWEGLHAWRAVCDASATSIAMRYLHVRARIHAAFSSHAPNACTCRPVPAAMPHAKSRHLFTAFGSLGHLLVRRRAPMCLAGCSVTWRWAGARGCGRSCHTACMASRPLVLQMMQQAQRALMVWMTASWQQQGWWRLCPACQCWICLAWTAETDSWRSYVRRSPTCRSGGT